MNQSLPETLKLGNSAQQTERYRLGIPVKVVGGDLRSHDSRRWQNQPHLSVSLAYVRDIFEYLHSRNIRFYRLAGSLAPYLTHPDMPQFHGQLEECSTELAAIGDLARLYGIRLTMHPGFYIQLGSPESRLVRRSIEELAGAAALLDAMGVGDESTMVIHVGGAYDDKLASRARFVETVNQLPSLLRKRIVLENDDRLFDLEDVMWVQQQTGLRIVLDVLHHRCLNDNGVSLIEALRLALSTWPVDQQPKIHFSTPRTEARQLFRNGRPHLQMPLARQHSDFLNPFEFIDLLRAARAAKLRPFDVMLEAKGKDLALLRLRDDVSRYAPELAGFVQ